MSNFMNPNISMVSQYDLKVTEKEQKKDDARDRILAIALHAFANRGFEGVSTTELAKAAGVTQPLIHYHFKSKKALWQTIVRNSFATMNEEFIQPARRTSKATMIEKVEHMIEGFVTFIAQKTEFAKILISEGTQGSDRMNWMVEELLSPCLQELEMAYKEGVEAGVLVEMPISHLVAIVLGAASQFFNMTPLMSSLFNVNTSDQQMIDSYTHIVGDMLKKALIQYKTTEA